MLGKIKRLKSEVEIAKSNGRSKYISLNINDVLELIEQYEELLKKEARVANDQRMAIEKIDSLIAHYKR